MLLAGGRPWIRRAAVTRSRWAWQGSTASVKGGGQLCRAEQGCHLPGCAHGGRWWRPWSGSATDDLLAL